MNLIADIFRCFATQFTQHPYSCLMLAAIQYNNAIFHIFSGPLFANVQGYAYLDLIIWGISPLLYLICRPILLKIIKIQSMKQSQLRQIQTIGNDKTKILNLIKKHQKDLFTYHQKRLYLLIGLFISTFISFLFMNYSQTFNWNYFTRVINLDFGYLVFDFSCRSMTMIVQIEEEEEHQQKKRFLFSSQQQRKQNKQIMSYHQCQVYCKFRNYSAFLAYLIIFGLFSCGKFDINHRYSGQNVLAICSVISCLVTLGVPFLYYFHFKTKYFKKIGRIKQISRGFKNNYTQLQQDPEENDSIQLTNQAWINDQIQVNTIMSYFFQVNRKQNNPCSPPSLFSNTQKFIKIENQERRTNNIEILNIVYQMKKNQILRLFFSYICITFSLIINISYLALWIMQSLKDQESYIQYNQTLLVCSTFFMIATPLNYYSSTFNKTNCNIQFSQKNTSESQPFNKIMLVLNSSFLFFAFFLEHFLKISLEDKLIMFVVCTILLGFNINLSNFLTFKLQNLMDECQINVDLQVVYIYMETIAYLIIPILIFLLNANQQTYTIYGYASSISLGLGAILI